MLLVYEFSCKSKHFILFKRINVPLFAVTFLLFPYFPFILGAKCAPCVLSWFEDNAGYTRWD